MNTITTAEQIEATAADLGLSMTAEFIPWSQSRNASEKMPSLNWKVTLLGRGKPIITTDYSAGCGHCAAYKASVKQLGNQNSILRDKAIRKECETGKEYRGENSIGPAHNPQFADVLHSLVSDAGAIDFATFEDWANEFGYDEDSRKGEAIYRTCLEFGLKLRSFLGDAGLSTLRDAVANY